ncbi:MAG: GGDEF domain-containing protein [Longicatena sp.]
MDRNLRNEAEMAYVGINNKWLNFHFRLLVVSVIAAFVLEIIMYVVIYLSQGIQISIWLYWLKYIICPSSAGVVLASIGRLIMKSRKITVRKKEYYISFLFALFAFVLSFVHNAYVGIFLVAGLPILITVFYENQRLSALIWLTTVLLQLFCAFTILWDPNKVLDHTYIVNSLIIISGICFIWIVTYVMILFMNVKSKIIIDNDIERQTLAIKIKLDDLTKVGSKQALLNQLSNLKYYESNTYFLVMLDIDDFKQINDGFGHLLGDEVLKCLGYCLRELNANCMAYRYGGDEFSILFTNENMASVINTIKSLQYSFGVRLYDIHADMGITISAGISQYQIGMSVVELLKRADDALYESKKRSKNAITICNL